MNRIQTHFTHGVWQSTAVDTQANLQLKGNIYLANDAIGVKELLLDLKKTNNPADIMRLLKSFNGFYAWVHQTSNQIIAAVDHVRSRPLFYACVKDHFYLSDDAEYVRQQVNDQKMDSLAREEFQLTGYVTGADTLFYSVKQIQAGEFLIAKQNKNDINIETHRYYSFLHTEPEKYDENLLYQQLDQVAVNIIQRLINYANGRQVVVPLSGGYDSRLIVTLLKRLGYENILTFTYGVKGNKESTYSKKVADSLGLKSYFVEYSEKLWQEALATEKYWAYQEWASGWSSTAHVQDWLAVKAMKEQGMLDSDCLFVPGHSGDFVAGSHIPADAFARFSFTLNDAIDAVLYSHYKLAPLKSFKTSRRDWAERIRDRMEQHDDITTAWEYADVFEKWDWQERQAKFICNSVRVYEFFDYDWWMPLWDIEFMKFWEKVPLKLRKERKWYLQYVKEKYGDMAMDENASDLNNASDHVRPVVIELLSKVNMINNLKKINFLNNMIKIMLRENRGNLWDGCFSKNDYKKYLEKNISINGMFADMFLKRTKFY